MAAITLTAINRRSAGTRILDDVSLRVESGELMVIVGPSGSGKTSLIRAIAGLDELSSGSVFFDDDEVTHIPVAERDVGLIFAENALFPTHSVRNNIAMSLWARSVNRKQVDERVDAEARALDISAIIDRWPNELSTGHQQLVQIARAMVRVPRVLLLDEPMAHLDLPTRKRLRAELRQLQRGYGVTTVLATNDPADAMFMADRITAIDSGRIRQIGTPDELHTAPATTHIAWLTGSIGLLNATVQSEGEGFWLVGDGFRLRAWAPVLRDFVAADVQVAPPTIENRSAAKSLEAAACARTPANITAPPTINN
ncbi:MAG: ABC transporter ATP-binding protein, partial [Acidimicrobiales bacterium]